MINDSVQKFFESLLDLINVCKNYDAELGANAKSEMFDSAKQFSTQINESARDLNSLTEQQKDQLGFVFNEKLFKLLE